MENYDYYHDFMRCKTKEEEKKSREEYVKNYGTYISYWGLMFRVYQMSKFMKKM